MEINDTIIKINNRAVDWNIEIEFDKNRFVLIIFNNNNIGCSCPFCFHAIDQNKVLSAVTPGLPRCLSQRKGEKDSGSSPERHRRAKKSFVLSLLLNSNLTDILLLTLFQNYCYKHLF